MYIKDQAICIRKVDYSDTSQIVTLFCRENGKISAIAKGARRAKSSFGSPIGIFSVGNIVYLPPKSGALATVAEFEHLPAFISLHGSLFSMNAGLMMCEIVGMLMDEYDPHTGLYDKFITFLEDISAASSQHRKLSLVIVFELALLSEVGLGMPLNNCCNCRGGLEGGDVYFCAESGGFVCRDCEASFLDKFRVSAGVLEAVTKPQTLAGQPESVLWDAEKLLIHHFAYIMHKMPRTVSLFLAHQKQGAVKQANA